MDKLAVWRDSGLLHRLVSRGLSSELFRESRAAMTQALAKREQPWDPMLEFELYWFRLYLTRNASQKSEPDGSWFIGDVEDGAELKIERWCPYSVARKSTVSRPESRNEHEWTTQ